MSVNLFRVILPVPDIERAVACYSRLLDMPGERISERRHYFDCGGTILALVDPAGHDRDWRANPDLIYFSVADLERAYQRAQEAGCTELEGTGLVEGGHQIAVRPWGERSFYCRDPFGNPICFVDERTMFTGGGTA